jgi:hypothetical protein
MFSYLSQMVCAVLGLHTLSWCCYRYPEIWTSSIDWIQRNRFYLKTETEVTLRNGVFLNINWMTYRKHVTCLLSTIMVRSMRMYKLHGHKENTDAVLLRGSTCLPTRCLEMGCITPLFYCCVRALLSNGCFCGSTVNTLQYLSKKNVNKIHCP